VESGSLRRSRLSVLYHHCFSGNWEARNEVVKGRTPTRISDLDMLIYPSSHLQ